MIEDEMVGWHHRLNGHELEQAPGVGDEQGSLACCSPWGRRELDTSERLNNSSRPVSSNRVTHLTSPVSQGQDTAQGPITRRAFGVPGALSKGAPATSLANAPEVTQVPGHLSAPAFPASSASADPAFSRPGLWTKEISQAHWPAPS